MLTLEDADTRRFTTQTDKAGKGYEETLNSGELEIAGILCDLIWLL